MDSDFAQTQRHNQRMFTQKSRFPAILKDDLHYRFRGDEVSLSKGHYSFSNTQISMILQTNEII